MKRMYQVTVTMTVSATSEKNAHEVVQDFVSEGFVREYDHIIDYDVSEAKRMFPGSDDMNFSDEVKGIN